MKASKALIILTITLFFSAWSHSSGSEIPCKHDTLEFNPEIGHFDEEYLVSDSRVLQDASSYPNIRIYPYYDSLTFGTDDFKSYIKNELLPPIVSLLQAALRIKYPLKSPMLLSQSKICGLDTPPILNVTGVDTDFFIFLAATEDNSSSWVASASNCMVSSGIKRPTIAYLALNTYAIRPVVPDSNPLGHEYNMYVLMHEIFHSLGFSQNFFNNYVDSQGNLLTGHIKKVLLAGTNRTVIDVAPLTQRLRNFYGCPTLEGAFMEDDGGSGTAGSHWERRFFPFDLLSSGAIHGRRITEFTLAFLEGTGWYVPDYSYAEPFFFGQGQGCSFIYTACDATANVSQFDDYCVGNGRACTSIGRGGGFCKNDICSDSCRFVTPQLEYDCENPNGIYYTPFSSKQVYGRGLGSKCFSGNLSTSGTLSKTTYCLKFNCVGQGVGTTLELNFGATKLVCTQKGQISVPGYSGFVDCPDPIQYCNTIAKPYCPRGCSARGSCVNNQCVCNPGFKGIDCAYRDLTITTQTI